MTIFLEKGQTAYEKDENMWLFDKMKFIEVAYNLMIIFKNLESQKKNFT